MLDRPIAHRAGKPGNDDGVGELAGRYGFRRVERVHFHTVDGARIATVVGVTHRYPRSVRVPFRVAARLVAAGAPVTVGS